MTNPARLHDQIRSASRAPLGATLAALLVAGAALAICPAPAAAFDELDVPSHKTTKLGLYVLAIDAERMVGLAADRILFVDIRTEPEVELLGLPSVIDANVPFETYRTPFAWSAKRQGLERTRNPGFAQAVQERLSKKRLTKADTVILISRAGALSARAADELADAGFTRVYSVVDGFEGDRATSGPYAGRKATNGWKLSRLPWSYVRDPSRLSVQRSEP